MKIEENKKTRPDLRPYQPLGIPLLKFLAGIAIIALIVVAIYEFAF